eukprot:TRINITY_DN4369_c0_g2_i6.p1 TRINITY_DN4369_c0_g2~~TRINITY_DN4369_c0_g2_i6.p1  ORF type:complete len:166 (+),score=28.63 TRINITY_DN4369_c0_g2_i6:36-500(+)
MFGFPEISENSKKSSIDGVTGLIRLMEDPKVLVQEVSSLSHQQLKSHSAGVSAPKVTIFRDAILDLIEEELGENLTDEARLGWRTILNYSGGAYMYSRQQQQERVRIITTSWKIANESQPDMGQEQMRSEGSDGEENADEVRPTGMFVLPGKKR